MREKLSIALAAALGCFVFYTAALGPFESLIQRAIFLALVSGLGLTLYPLGEGRRWRPLGILVDLALAAALIAACVYVIVNYDEIMTTLPWATTLDIALTAGLVIGVLELGRRAVGGVFPTLVALGLAYALLGHFLPSPIGHRGFDIEFVTETLFLGDLGVWGLLLGVASTVIAAFVLFGSLLLHTGGGQTFMDLAMRLGGRSVGGAAKIATISSGLFGMVSGSAVANVATTGNFTIPMMLRLGYPAPFAAAVEAVASTGGQVAPPIMGAAAFVMAEILGVSYVTVMVAAILPALLFYLSVFMTIDVVARRRGLRVVPENELPAWSEILRPRKALPLVIALTGLFAGVFMGKSIATAAFYGIVGLLVAFAALQGPALGLRASAAAIGRGLIDAGRGMVIIGVLLAGAQILVSIVNLTGVGVVLSSLIVSLAGDQIFLVSIIVGAICLIMGMGLPTTAAYVLVSAVLAPAMTEVGVAPLTAHLFVFYFATLSVITPPVCIAVFVGAGIAKTNWLPAALEAVRLAAVIYLVPFLLLLYPGLVGQGGWIEILEAAISGGVLVIAIPKMLGGSAITGSRLSDAALYLTVIALAIIAHWVALVAAVALLTGLMVWRPQRAAEAAAATSGGAPQ